jgi:GntR family transcriptional regulator
VVHNDIRRRFLRHLNDARFRPGELIGSERELSGRLGVGRAALRLVLEALENDGVIRRSLGRGGGVFFHDGRVQRYLNTIQGVPEMVRQQGMTVSTRILSADIATPDVDEVRNLRLLDTEKVIRIVRLRLVENVSWSLDTSVLPSSLFPRLLTHDLTGSLYSILSTNFGTVLDHADETIEVVLSTRAQSSVLSVEEASPLLLIWRVTYSADGDVVEFAHDYFRADRTRIHTQKFGVNWKRAVRREKAIASAEAASSLDDSNA